MRRTTIISSEVDPETGAGVPGTQVVVETTYYRCPSTCLGVVGVSVALGERPFVHPCTHCGWA